jgi:hypothetical protein
MDDRQYIRISELLLLCYDGTAGREEIAELEALLDGNRPALEYCVDISKELNYFRCMGQVPLSQPASVQGLDTEFMSALEPQQQMALLGDFAEYEKQAAAIEIAKPEDVEERQLIRKIRYERPVRTINKFSLAVGILSMAALLFMLLYIHLAPPVPYEVATVFDAIDAEWSSDLPINSSTRISSNSEPIRLTRGIVKFRTDDQVDIVLEAPAEFYFPSYSEISMNYGKLFAHVTEQGYGFSVTTPNSKIIDLGTEFGVLSHIDGNTEVHLYKGKANVFAGEKQQRKTSQLLTAGSAIKVDSKNAVVETIALDEQALVRNIDSRTDFVWKGQHALRLTDLLLGGDGFGTASQRNIEYNPASGAAVSSGDIGYREGPGKLVRIPASPYLDGIFVPGGSDGDTVVSSAGHRFAECPETSGLYYSNITCQKDWTFFEPLEQQFEQSEKQFPDSGVLYLHSNIGLTVDLNAVRQAVPGLRLSSFSAFAGIIRMGNNAPEYSEVDIWVLVDGQLRSVRKGLGIGQGCDIDVDIAPADRFLTLAVTDGGHINAEGFPANHFDTCGFAEPVFELELP